MVCKLEEALKNKNSSTIQHRLAESNIDANSLYKEQYEQLFEENLTLKEENEILLEKVGRVEGGESPSKHKHKIIVLQAKLAKTIS
jgi:hypothetical protein